jgi:hypothetical protein
MPLFGKRKSVPQQQIADQRVLDEAQNNFSARFKAWLDAVGRAQVDTGADALTDEIIGRVGVLPQPETEPTLNRTQLIFLQSYARSYGTRMLQHHRTQAVVAAVEAERAGAEDSQQRQNAADYWGSVEAYAAQILG